MSADGTDDPSDADADDWTPDGAETTTGADTGVDPDQLRTDLDALDRRLEDKTVSRATLEADLKAYVRRRLRRGHARGWGPYLVLLYGTAMTIGAFRFLDGGWAIAAMIVVWLSTLGLFVFMLVVNLGLSAAARAGGLANLLGRLRE